MESALSEDISMREKLGFMSYHSSNLDEFFCVRVAAYRRAAEGKISIDEVSHPRAMLERINMIVSSQMLDASEIVKTAICEELKKRGVVLHCSTEGLTEEQTRFAKEYFDKETIPYIQSVLLNKGMLVFLTNNRPYFAVKLRKKTRNGLSKSYDYAVVKLPLGSLPRFIEIPIGRDRYRHVMFIDDIVRIGMPELFPGYQVEGMWCIKMSRDADLGISEDFDGDIAGEIRDNLVNRKTGAPAGFYHDISTPKDMLQCLKKNFGFAENEMVACGRYLNLSQLVDFPEGLIREKKYQERPKVVPKRLKVSPSLLSVVEEGDLMLHFPYESFDYVIRLFNEAARDPKVTEIKVTQYRVATNSAVVDSLIMAAANNKKVTVFVELKARFDERNNLLLSERMKAAGIRIIYSIPNLKVHAKIALIVRESGDGQSKSIAYISTGNFNEQTAAVYTDHGLFTEDAAICEDLNTVFRYLENTNYKPKMRKLIVSQINMTQRLIGLIDKEKEIAERGGEGRIVLKVNGLQNRDIIDKLYEASMAGVKITLIVRGICCLVPGQPYSENIVLKRLVDKYLEHGRIWAFGPNGDRGVFTSSSDLLNRNIFKRVEVTVPIENSGIRGRLMEILDLMERDNVKMRLIDETMNNKEQKRGKNEKAIRAQEDIYDLLERAEQ